MDNYYVQYHLGTPETGFQPYHAHRDDEESLPYEKWKRGTVVVPSQSKGSYQPMSKSDLTAFLGHWTGIPGAF